MGDVDSLRLCPSFGSDGGLGCIPSPIPGTPSDSVPPKTSNSSSLTSTTSRSNIPSATTDTSPLSTHTTDPGEPVTIITPPTSLVWSSLQPPPTPSPSANSQASPRQTSTQSEAISADASTRAESAVSSDANGMITSSPSSSVVLSSSAAPSNSASPLQAPRRVSKSGATIGVAVGAGISIVVLIILLVWCLRRRRQRNRQTTGRIDMESKKEPSGESTETLVPAEPQAQDQRDTSKTSRTSQQPQATGSPIPPPSPSGAYPDLPHRLLSYTSPEATSPLPTAWPEKGIVYSMAGTPPVPTFCLDVASYMEHWQIPRLGGRSDSTTAEAVSSRDDESVALRSGCEAVDGGVRLAGGHLDEVAGLDESPHGEMFPPPYARYLS